MYVYMSELYVACITNIIHYVQYIDYEILQYDFVPKKKKKVLKK